MKFTRMDYGSLAHLVQVPMKMLDRYAQLVEEAINEVGGRYVFSKSSSSRLFIQEAYPRRDADRDQEQGARRPLRPRQSFNFGTDR